MGSNKYFKNPFPDYSPEIATKFILDKRLKPNISIVTLLPEKWQITMETLEKADRKDVTMYTGTGGIALLKYLKDPNNPEVLQEILHLLNLKSLRNKRQTFLCGDGGPLALGIIVNKKLGNEKEAQSLIEQLKNMKDAALDISSDFPSEYMYGRSGYLYALLFVNKNVNPPPFEGGLIRSIVEAILKIGQIKAKSEGFNCPLMYEWHNSYYLGAAHGVSGILFLLLNCTEYLLELEIMGLIKPTIDYLATLRFSSGNFPSSYKSENDKYVQWCHGAPGFLYMFTKAYKVFNNPAYLELAILCGDVIWKRGLLRKGYSLCHGVSGNGYCFLELYKITQDEKHLYRAIRFAEWCLDYNEAHEETPPDRPLSLFEGIAGPMYFLLDIQRPMDAKFPGFSL
ncbi:unnamed protein product [Brassicogethes aeneus]|uniref:LanC-like protein 2 n=1 Tax=Brassicogethes aeneus TaxID=1431903 RepID=A0A9P0FHF4_BRAAE|nr:unnamed protein product [Brassicogethes aeneus]